MEAELIVKESPTEHAKELAALQIPDPNTCSRVIAIATQYANAVDPELQCSSTGRELLCGLKDAAERFELETYHTIASAIKNLADPTGW